MATRVFELARELGVTSKVVLDKCRAEGLDVKNHMSTLSAGLEATVREWFSETTDGGGSAVETANHVDLEVARTEARKQRHRKTEIQAEAAEAPAQQLAEQQAVAQALAEPPAVTAEGLAPPVEAQGLGEVAGAPAAEPLEGLQVAAEPGQKPARPAVRPAEEIRPAGPQLVPKPAVLRGPRVVRVEKPDFLPAPRLRKAPANLEMVDDEALLEAPVKRGKGDHPTEDLQGEAGKKKTKRRSPRHRSGRAGEGGDGLKEWRNQDLLERSERLAAAGGGLRRHRATVSGRPALGPSIKPQQVDIQEPITTKNLSATTGIKVADIMKKLLGLGVMAGINQTVERGVAETIMADYGIELAVRQAKSAEEELIEQLAARSKGQLAPRAPVVTFLGHVDHGKTSLLDRIRQTAVTEGEAGGITQHIGAYRLDRGSSHVVFLDTPGHEAFTAMRARGANMTDVVVLVIAADDGVMPQTIEAISHARAAKVPIVVALNKIDMPNANIQRALGQLGEQGLQPREWGGNVEVIQTSATTGQGVDTLVETLSLEAELLELKAETDAGASGYVVEAEMDLGLGALTRLLVLNGTLKVGDVVLAGKACGHVRSMRDDHGRNLTEALPATPVEISGLDEMPEAGDKFCVVPDLDQARDVARQRQQAARTKGLNVSSRQGLESLLSQIGSDGPQELALILKTDVQGSLEAIIGSIQKLGTEEIKVRMLHAAVGGVSTGDVTLAEASGAIILGFNVVPDAAARQLAKAKGVDIRLYRVIYDIIDDIRTAMEKGLAPEIRQETIGHAEVRQVFKVSRVGTIAGCLATDGLIRRNAKVRIVRDQVVIEDNRAVESLKRFKDDAREVRAGLECGVKIAGYDDIKQGDVLEFYQQVEVARTL